MGASCAPLTSSSINSPPGSAHKAYYPLIPRTRYGGLHVHLDSGRNLYIGRSFYHMGPTMISRGGSLHQSQEQLDSFFAIQTTFPPRPFAYQGWDPIKRKISPWCPKGLLVSCNKQDFLFIARHKCEFYSSPTWRASQCKGVPI